jgi:DNA-binding MarR family transcriptional regulator
MPVNKTPPPSAADTVGFEPRLFLREEELDRALELALAAQRVLESIAEPAQADDTLGSGHWRVLSALRRRPGQSVAALRTRLAIPKQSLARLLDDLQTAGLITRAVANADRRRRALSLTEAGRAREAAIAAGGRARLAAAFRAAGPQAVAGARDVWLALLASAPEAGP